MVTENLKKVEKKIESACTRAGRDRNDVTLIAVSKTKPVEMMREAMQCGIVTFGENKVQEIVEKQKELTEPLDWHMIGHLQRNKVKYIIDKVTLIHAVDRYSLLKEIEKQAAKRDLEMPVLIQVNIAKEESKHGFEVEEIDEVYVYCSSEDIQNYIPEGVKYLKRSQTLDTDTTKMNEVLASFAGEVYADMYVMTHTTAPFISADSIKKGIAAVKSGEYDSAFAVKKLQDFLWKDGKPFNYELNQIPRTQDLPVLYEETSGFYIYRPQVITELNRRIGNHPYMVEVSEIESVDIDEKEDFEIADAIFNHMFLEK